MKKNKIFTFILMTVLCFISCRSTAEQKIDSVYVMVYDYDNSEIMDVSIYMNDKLLGKTDVYGRLMFPLKEDQKMYTVKAEKEGYETVSTKTIFRAGQLLYFRIGSGIYYAEQSEKFLDQKDTVKAIKMINKALEIENRKDWQFLKEVILRGKNEE